MYYDILVTYITETDNMYAYILYTWY